MKRKTAALYDPYLDIIGGGEKHILSILKVFEDSGYDVTIFWDEDLSKAIQNRLNITFKTLTFQKNIFKTHSSPLHLLQKAQQLSKYDAFLYITDGSYYLSNAKQTIVFCMVPKKSIYNMNLINRIKTHNTQFISNSIFTKKNLQQWGIQSDVLYPFIEDRFMNIDVKRLKKQKVILSVGRFYKHLHAKRHDIIIQFYKKMKAELPALDDYQLILTGGLKEEDKPYYTELLQQADGDKTIIFKPNSSYEELLSLYENAEIYWHMAGYEVNENTHPELTEHLGMTPLEAMAAGCTVFCYRAGGPKEIIQDGKTGFLFSDYNELKEKMAPIVEKKVDISELQTNGKQFLKNTFSHEVFEEHTKSVLHI